MVSEEIDLPHARLEQELKTLQQEDFDALFGSDHLYLLRIEISSGKILQINDALARLIGLKDRSHLADYLQDHILFATEADRSEVTKLVTSESPTNELTVNLVHQTGISIPVRLSWSRGVLKPSILLIAQDLSALTEANRQAQNERQRVEGFSSAAFGWLWEMDADLKFTFLSEKVEEISGFERSALLGRRREELIDIDPDDENWKQHLDDLQNHRPFRNFHYSRPDTHNVSRFFSLNGNPFFDENGKFAGYRGTASEVTNEKEAQLAVKTAEDQHQSILQSLPVAISMYDSDNRMVFYNDRYAEIAIPAGDSLKKGVKFDDLFRAYVRNEQPDLTDSELEDVVATRMKRFNTVQDDVQVLRNGRWLNARLHRTSDGGTLNVLEDITELVKAHISVEENQAFLRDVIDSLPVSLDIWDAEERLIMANKTHLDWMPEHGPVMVEGAHLSETIKINASMIYPNGPVDLVEKYIEERLDRFRHAAEGDVEEVKFKDRWFQGQRYQLANGNQMMTFSDVTELKEREEQLRQSQKMEAVGQLTGGIAHDFNNLLQVISGNLELLESLIEGNADAVSCVKRAMEASGRGASLTNNLLAFSRKQALQPSAQDISQRLVGIMNTAQRTLTATIDTLLETEDGLWPVSIDPNYFDSALLNLLINSRDAMPDGGTITVTARNVVLNEAFTSGLVNISSGEYVRLDVSDTGKGIADDCKTQSNNGPQKRLRIAVVAE
jgi:two-component system, cell cycle sensor histidine kinase and response regulator CckA